ncbi:hypothetical protein THRCLA_07819 [Thraustotheca clavata]|uniref:Uncharacterized protein n=1 Tax=Thraustotheca clavata TaxID=74557 RepID=A0A1V9ZBX9_9STRA|nr:hypothetical protein THRCLA_07819 [Thraustotheca clavata]
MIVYGIASTVLTLAACLLSIFALILPTWSSTVNLSFTGGSIVLKTPFAAGAWGFCTNVEMDTSNGFYKGHCALYQSHEVELSDKSLITMEPTGICALSTSSVTYTNLRQSSNLTEFDKFVNDTCGSNAWTTLAFIQVIIALTVLGFFAMVVAMALSCVPGRRFLQAHATLAHLTVTLLAIFLSIIVMCTWAAQAPSHVSYGASYHYLCVAFVFCMVSAALTFKYRLEVLRSFDFNRVPQPNRTSVSAVKDDDLFGTSQTPYKEDDEPKTTTVV